MSIHLVLGSLAILLISNACAHAIFMQIETEKVPIDRVMQNLQKRLAADTNNVEVLYHLARIHSMAFLAHDELRHLALWQDSNGNGISESGEVRTVGEVGITGIKCDGESSSSNILFNPRGVVFRDGTTRPTYDWFVPMNTSHSN